MTRLLLIAALMGCGASSVPRSSTSCGAGGVPEEPDMANDGDCEIRHEGCCYQQSRDACRAAGCEEDCLILESYPGQVDCQ